MVCLVDSLEYLKDDKKQQVQALEHLSEMCLQGSNLILFYNIIFDCCCQLIPVVLQNCKTAD